MCAPCVPRYLIFRAIASAIPGASSADTPSARISCHAVLRVLVLFALVTPFWSLFDQKASTWVLQADQMVKPEWFQSSMMQALNPALVMILIPFNNLVLYPLLERSGVKVTALRRMGAGIALAGAAWIVAGVLQLWLDAGDRVSIVWQMLPYALLTLGIAEICRVSISQIKSLAMTSSSINGVDSFIPAAWHLQRPGLLLGFAAAFALFSVVGYGALRLLASTALAGVATLLLLMWPVERSARREPLPR